MKSSIESGSCPLTPLQHGMLLRVLADPHSGVDVQQLLVEIPESISPATLEDALQALATRHDVLRTVLHRTGTGEVRQSWPTSCLPGFRFEDWSAESPGERQRRFDTLVQEDRMRGFALTGEPFVRATLCQFGPEHFEWLFTSWHGVFDGRSGVILQRELFDIYDALRGRRVLELPRTHPFRDFVDWITSLDFTAGRAFWRDLLANVPSVAAPEGVSHFEAGECREMAQELDPPVVSLLRDAAERTGVSENAWLQAAWALVQARLDGRSPVVFGTTRACRRSALDGAPGAESMVGVLINTVPVRADIGPATTGLDLARQIRAQHLAVRPVEHTPLAETQALGQRAGGRLFDTLFLYEHDTIGNVMRGLGGQWLRRSVRLREATGHRITAYGYGGPQPSIKIAYDRSRVPDARGEQLLGDFAGALAAIVDRPDLPLAHVVLPSAASPPLQATSGSLEGLLDHLRRLDVRLWNDGDRLRCSAPPGVLTPELQQALTNNKPALIRLLAERPAPSQQVARLPDRPNYLASHTQERMWLLQQLVPQSDAYVVAGAILVNGALDAETLRAAWRDLAERHELLRSRLTMLDGALSVVADGPWPEFVIVDEPMCPRDLRPTVMERLRTNAWTPFDMTRGPLARLTFVRFDDEQVVVVQVHHVVSDFWSLHVMIRDLAAAYSRRLGRRAAQPALPYRYVDFAAWHRQLVAGSALRGEREFWSAELSGARALDLPTDYPRPAASSLRGDVVVRPMSPGLAAAIRRIAQSHAVTPFVALMSAFAALAVRYTGQQDFVLGVPVAGRTEPHSESVVGPFINTLAVRVRAEGHPTARALVAHVRDVVLSAQAHQHLPFERVIGGLESLRDSSSAQLVRVMINGIGGPRDFDFAGVPAERLVAPWKTSLVDLTVYADLEDWRHLLAEYSTELFARGTIETLLDHLERVTYAIAGQPDCRVGELPLLSADEYTQLTRTWNDTVRVWPEASSVVDLFDAQAGRTPDRVAIRTATESVTYAELDRHASRLAAALRTRGVGRDVLVAVGVDRSALLVAAALAVWKAGGAYVPLDPAYPEGRLAHMLEDSGARILLTERALRRSWPATTAEVLVAEDLAEDTPGDVPASDRDPDALAYVIYTSGSTGKSKGVEIPQRALLNFLRSMAERPGFTERDVLLAVTTLSFDIAGLELYLPLVCGGSIELASRAEAADGRALLERMATGGVTVLQATPATFRLLIDAGWARTPRLRVLTGGEALSPELAQALVDRAAEVWNMYGPTETTVWSVIDRVERDEPILIGRPVANTTVYVLDGTLAPVPVGVPGELYIGGEGLARGYHARPELTAERFVPDPFVGGVARMYRTGDLARWRPDGRLECLGRLDHQVKIRGFRIELGEIESVLAQHPAVKQAVVTVFEPGPGDRRLAAYVVPVGGTMDEQALRQHLKQHVPEYMVPSFIVSMAVLPLTDNGKVNRLALPVPSVERRPSSGSSAPATTTERVIAEVWRDVLRAADVPCDENFFDLGGHSLLFAQVQVRLERALERNIPMLDLFRFPTVRTLAAHLSAAEAVAGHPEALA